MKFLLLRPSEIVWPIRYYFNYRNIKDPVEARDHPPAKLNMN